MRFLDVLAIVALVVLAIYGKIAGWGGDEGDGYRRPPPHVAERTPPPDQGALEPLPGPSPFDPAFRVEVGAATSSSGTAFSVDGDGRWLTARHVVEDCHRVVLRTGPRQGVRVARVLRHPGADVAVLWTEGGALALALSGAELKVGQGGYYVGYPRGEPGDVHARILGRRTMRISGRYRTSEPVIAWTQVARVPDRGPDLGGLSGGPALDAAGRVIGIVVAGAPRRGRSYTAAPRSVFEALSQARLDIRPREGSARRARFTSADFARQGSDLRARLTVAKVYCMVDDGPPRRRGRRRSRI